MRNNQVLDKSAAPLGANANGAAFNFKGGRLVLGAFGTFGGGTLALQYTIDSDATWIALGPQTPGALPTSLTAAGTVAVYLPPIRLRVSLAGSTTPSLSYWVGNADDS